MFTLLVSEQQKKMREYKIGNSFDKKNLNHTR